MAIKHQKVTPKKKSKLAKATTLLDTRITLVIALSLSLVAVAICLIFVAATDCGRTAKVKVGVLVAMSGSSSSTGIGSVKGVQLAVQQLGAKNVEIVQEDSKCDPKVAPVAVKRLIEQKVVAIIGDACSSSSLSVLAQVNASRIPLISPSASSPRLSISNDYFFRVIPSDENQGNFLARVVTGRGFKRAAVFFTNEAYGSSIAHIFSQDFASAGGSVVASVYSDSGDVNLEQQATKVMAANPDVVMVFSNATSNTSVSLVQTLRKKGFSGQLVGGDALYEEAIIDSTQGGAEGLLVSAFSIGDTEFLKSMQDKFKTSDLNYGAAQGYDAFQSIQIALQKGAKSGEDIANIMHNMQFNGVSGRISFDENGDVPGAPYGYGLLQVKNNKFTVVNNE